MMRVNKRVSTTRDTLSVTHAALFIDVVTTTANPDDAPVRTDRINWNNPRARRWFDKHATWALNVGLCIHAKAVQP